LTVLLGDLGRGGHQKRLDDGGGDNYKRWMENKKKDPLAELNLMAGISDFMYATATKRGCAKIGGNKASKVQPHIRYVENFGDQ